MDRFVCIVIASCWGYVSFRKSPSLNGVVFKNLVVCREASGIRLQGVVLVNRIVVLPISRGWRGDGKNRNR